MNYKWSVLQGNRIISNLLASKKFMECQFPTCANKSRLFILKQCAKRGLAFPDLRFWLSYNPK